jgi:hypothetical protein
LKPASHDGDVMIAVTFAEAGEWETARVYAPPRGRGRLGAWIEGHLLAAALAEEGVRDEALRLVGAVRARPQPDRDALDALLRARGVRMFSGVLSPAALSARR